MDNKFLSPLVSVLMTAYNREKYIAEAIESVLASTYTNFELLIVDDCSKDKTLEIARTYEKTDNRIKVFLNKKNLGDYPNRNYVASLATGKYIKYLDSDDIIYPHGLQVMVSAMEQYPEAGIGLAFNNYDEKEMLPVVMSSDEAYKYHFFNKGLLYIGPSGAIYSRQFFMDIGGFHNFKVASDYEFNLRAAQTKNIVLFHRDLFWWRQHDGQEIINQNKNNEYVILNYTIHKKNLTAFSSFPLKTKALKNNDILMARRMWRNYILKFRFRQFMFIIKNSGFALGLLRKVFYKVGKI